MENALLNGLTGILGGILGALVVSILSQRKNRAEIDHLKAETKRINLELENVQNKWYRELLSNLLDHVHVSTGKASHMTRSWREKPMLAGKSDEDILGLLEGTFTEFELKQLLKAGDRDAYFSDLEAWHEYTETERAAVDYHNFLVTKKILIDDELLLSACFELDVLLSGLLNITRLNIKKIAPGNLAEAHSKYNENVGRLVQKIEGLIKPELKPKIQKS